MTIPFILASASPARRKLLQTAGIDPIVRQSDFDESKVPLSDTIALVTTLAQCKAEVVAKQWSDGLILGCDSLLEVDGESYGKTLLTPKKRSPVGKKCAAIREFYIPVMR